jgi:YesN/AraC family two-component response regulator
MSNRQATYHINGMVCDRCIMAVEQLAQKLRLEPAVVELGTLSVFNTLSADQLQRLDRELDALGFELSESSHQQLVSQINSALTDYVRYLESEEQPELFSTYLKDQISYHYNYATQIYKRQTGRSIEQSLIRIKIERVKEWLETTDKTLSEIAWKLNYSSVQYLSNQFKKVTGQTVSEYRANPQSTRTTWDKA